jgi:hypothetical protein
MGRWEQLSPGDSSDTTSTASPGRLEKDLSRETLLVCFPRRSLWFSDYDDISRAGIVV